MPIFYFYCGIIGHNEKMCAKRKKDLSSNCVTKDQFGYLLRAGARNSEERGYKGRGAEREDGDYRRSVSLYKLGRDGEGELEKERKNKEDDGMKISETEGGHDEERTNDGIKLVGKGNVGRKMEESLTKTKIAIGTCVQKGNAQMVDHRGLEIMLIEDRGESMRVKVNTKGDGGELGIQEIEHDLTTRAPLSNCTNNVEVRKKLERRGLEKNTKGKWKKRARLHAAGPNMSDVKVQDEQGT